MLAAVAIAVAVVAAPAHAQGTALLPAQTAVGPSGDVDSLSGMSIAHDGTGGIVFLQNVNGVPHVFVSRLQQGVFQPAAQLDPNLAGPATQAQIAADSGGDLVVVFIDGGALYATQVNGPQSGFSVPQQLASAAEDPSLSVNRFGDGYVAYTAPDGSGHDVDVDYYSSVSGWAPASPQAMNETPGDTAGTGASRPSMLAAQDGVGIVAWGENGHVYSRRVWGTATSVETEQLDPNNVAGRPEVSADLPEVGVGGNSSYADITFREKVSDPPLTNGVQSRVLLAQLVAEDTEPAAAIDGLSAGSLDNAYQPNVSMSEFGSGFASAVTETGGQLLVTPLGTNGTPGSPVALTTPGSNQPPYAALTSSSGVIAWQQANAVGEPEILAATQNGTSWDAPLSISWGGTGPTDAQAGLQIGADGYGDTMIAWLQGTTSGPAIEYGELLTPSGASNPKHAVQYVNTPTPTLTWPAAREYWGAVTYTVTMDGTVLGQSQTTSFVPPAPLADGPHTWTVTAINAGGQQVVGSTGTVFVDTTKPKLALRVSGSLRAGSKLRLQNVASDGPNPTEPGSSPSGIASYTLAWGGGSKPLIGKALTKSTHTYTHKGNYKLSVTVVDRAGNATTVTRTLKIAAALKKPAVKGKPARGKGTPARSKGTPARSKHATHTGRR